MKTWSNIGKENPVSIAESWLKADLEVTLYSILSWLGDIIRLKVSEQAPHLDNPDLKSRLLNLSKNSAVTSLLDYYRKLSEQMEWSQANINTQLMLEDILINWVRVMR